MSTCAVCRCSNGPRLQGPKRSSADLFSNVSMCLSTSSLLHSDAPHGGDGECQVSRRTSTEEEIIQQSIETELACFMVPNVKKSLLLL